MKRLLCNCVTIIRQHIVINPGGRLLVCYIIFEDIDLLFAYTEVFGIFGRWQIFGLK